MSQPDVLVVGAGLAGLSAALARERGASVVVLERAAGGARRQQPLLDRRDAGGVFGY